MSNRMGNFRPPTSSQAGGNPKKKRRTSQNTATSGSVRDLVPTLSQSDTIFASNPFDDSPPMIGPHRMGSGPNSYMGMSPGVGPGARMSTKSVDGIGQISPMGSGGPGNIPGGMRPVLDHIIVGSGGIDPRVVVHGGTDTRRMGPCFDHRDVGPEGIDPRGFMLEGMDPRGIRHIHAMESRNINTQPGNLNHGGPSMGHGPAMIMGPRMGGGMIMMGGRPIMGGMMGPDGMGLTMGMNGPMGMHNSQMAGYGHSMCGVSNPGSNMLNGSMLSPMPHSNAPSGMTISTGPGSNSPHGSAHESGPGTPIGPLSGPSSTGGPSSHLSMMGPMHSPLTSVMSEKIYPPGQPMVFNTQNPSAPPIYPCGVCHKEVNDNDQAILCESGCNFWFHRVCTGLAETAFHFLTQEIYAEWVCDKCFTAKDVPLVKFKP